ncbi:MAG: UDP-3-O-acyl-N-acetylglucosamine deacetylase, partial [Terracidiphilus sp.]
MWQKCHTTRFPHAVYSKHSKGLQPRRGTLGQRAHQEQTIAEPLELSGVGLHSGAPVTMRLLPAPAGSGIV